MTRIDPGRSQPTAASKAPGAPETASLSQASKKEPATRPDDRFVAGQASQAKDRPADPLADFSEIRQRRSARADGVKGVPAKELSREQMLDKAREVLIRSFEKDFVPSPGFQDTFEGQQWPEIKDRIHADAKTFGADPDFEDAAEADGGITFIGHIYGLYTEVTVRKDGTVEQPYFEID